MSDKTVSIIGLGYIGLPTAAMFAASGIKVVGVDVNSYAVDTINQGKIHIVEPELDKLVSDVVANGYLRAVTKSIAADVFIIAVPTPFKGRHKPDISYIESAAEAIAPVIKKGDLVILESTSPVGTTEQMAEWLSYARPDLTFPQTHGEDSDIRIAHCPERVLPGRILKELEENDRIIGGITPKCSYEAAKLYKTFVKGECIITNAKTAEMCKLTENSFRDVNIAFANELSVICDKLGINVWELISLANRHPRVNILQPGCGVGGHCIAVDPWFIVSKSPKEAKLIRMAREVNNYKREWVVGKIDEAVSIFLAKNPTKNKDNIKIACFGLAFKPDIDDLRESPAVEIVKEIADQYKNILVVEPNIKELPRKLKLENIRLCTFDYALDNSDIVLLLVEHKEFKEVQPKIHPDQYIVDTKGIWDSSKFVKALSEKQRLNYAEELRISQVQKIEIEKQEQDKEIYYEGVFSEYQSKVEDLTNRLTEHQRNLKIFEISEKTLKEQLKYQQIALEKEEKQHRDTILKRTNETEAIRSSVPFLLGKALIESKKSFKNLILFPFIIYSISKQSKIQNKSIAKVKENITASNCNKSLIEHIDVIYVEQGLEAAEFFIENKIKSNRDKASALVRLSRLVLNINTYESARIARKSVELDPRIFRIKWLAFLLFDTGSIIESSAMLDSLPETIVMNEAEKNKAKYIKGCCAIFQKPPKILHAKISTIKSIDKKILYVASSSLPHQTTGYTTRTHAILKGICANGWDVTCTTRPGYPFDRNDLSVKYSDGVYELDGIIYEFLKGKGRRETPLDEYIYESAEILKKEMIQKCPSIVHAASNYEAGLPALIAAKELGIPFIYEVRGFWEYTSASKIEEWEKTERFALDYQLEALVAQNADLVITLNMAMADELVLRGVRREKIVFAPNALDIEKFYPVTKSNILAEKLGLKDDDFVIGYIGSIVNYEGLDTLIEAFCKVCQKIQNAKLLIVGNGKILSGLEKLAASFNVSDKVSFTGAVAHKDVQQYFSLINAITIPRKPHKVCQLVSPLKPLEAMGMEIPLIVSDVSALKEMVKDEQTGLIHKTDDPDSLAEAILRLAQNPALREQLAKNAKEEVITNKTWNKVTKDISRHYETLIKSRG